MRKGIFYFGLFFLILSANPLEWARASSKQTVIPLPIMESAAVQGAPDKQPWETEWEKIVESGKKEGKVNLYTSLGTEMRTTLGNAFTKRYGIELNVTSGRTAEIHAKISAERRAGLYVADLYIAGASTQIRLKESGALQPIEPALLLPEVTDRNQWQDGEMAFLDKDRVILVFAAHVNTPIVINSDMVNPPIKSVFELLAPKWKGKILMSDPTIGGAGATFITALGELHGEDFIRKLAGQDPTIVRDYRTHVEWVARGKFPIGTGPNPENVREFVKAGAHVATPPLQDLAFTSSANAMVSFLNHPAHPNAAKVFINWFLTKEGQTAFVKGVGTQSRRSDVTTEYTAPDRIRQPGVKYFNASTEEAARKMIYYQKICKEIFKQFLK